MSVIFIQDSATIGTTEYDLAADSTSLGAQTDTVELEALIRIAAMVAGDQYHIQLSDKTNGTLQLLWESWPTGTPTGAIVVPRLIVGEGWRLTATKVTGTDRVVHWSLRKLTNVLATGEIVAASFAAGAIDAAAIADNAIDAASIAANALTTVKFADGALTAAKFATDTLVKPLNAGTAAAGSTSSITLAASAVATADYYNGCTVAILGGAGAGQAARIAGYTAAKVASLDRVLATALDNTSVYVVIPALGHLDKSALVAADAGNTALTFKTDLTEATNDHWNDPWLVFVTGSLKGQSHKITDYVGASKFVVFAAPGFTAAPTAGDRFFLINK